MDNPPKSSNDIKYHNCPNFSDTYLTLDRKLEWKIHIENKLVAAKRFLYNTMKITYDNYGPKPEYMKWAFKGIVLPALAYGSIVWATRLG